MSLLYLNVSRDGKSLARAVLVLTLLVSTRRTDAATWKRRVCPIVLTNSCHLLLTSILSAKNISTCTRSIASSCVHCLLSNAIRAVSCITFQVGVSYRFATAMIARSADSSSEM